MGHLLLHAQAWWDAQRFDQPVWQVAAWREQKARHIQLHVAKALGKVVAAVGAGAATTSGPEQMARVRDEVLPDVAIYRSQLLNLFPEVCTPSSLSHRSASAGVQEGEPWLRVVLSLSRASAQLAAFLEPREHGAVSPVSHIREAIADLHASADLSQEMFWQLVEALVALEKPLASDQEQREALATPPPACQRLRTIPGMGPCSATACVATGSDASAVQHGRQCAAWLGLVPRQPAPGGKERWVGISPRGDR